MNTHLNTLLQVPDIDYEFGMFDDTISHCISIDNDNIHVLLQFLQICFAGCAPAGECSEVVLVVVAEEIWVWSR